MIKTEWVLTKDIFPTLYALSLSGVKYLSLGGRDMLAKPKGVKKEFGFNALVWMDKNGVYSNDRAYYFKHQDSLKNTEESFKPSEYHKNFAKAYKQLDLYQLIEHLGT